MVTTPIEDVIGVKLMFLRNLTFIWLLRFHFLYEVAVKCQSSMPICRSNVAASLYAYSCYYADQLYKESILLFLNTLH
jgi:hypothetical protein